MKKLVSSKIKRNHERSPALSQRIGQEPAGEQESYTLGDILYERERRRQKIQKKEVEE